MHAQDGNNAGRNDDEGTGVLVFAADGEPLSGARHRALCAGSGAAGNEATGTRRNKKVFARSASWPRDRFSRVIGDSWSGCTAICIASGPSLTDEQTQQVYARLKARAETTRVIVANDAYRAAPWAHALYFADAKWLAWHRERDDYKAFAGEKCTIFTTGNLVGDDDVHMLRRADGVDMSLDPELIATGANSGHQALNIAVLAGAKRILLLGYDARQAADGRKHFFGDHPDRTAPPFTTQVRCMHYAKPVLEREGIDVVNVTPGSAIDCFPREELVCALTA